MLQSRRQATAPGYPTGVFRVVDALDIAGLARTRNSISDTEIRNVSTHTTGHVVRQ